MALFEIIIELPVGTDANALASASERVGYKNAMVSATESEKLFSVLISDPRTSFDTGRSIAQALLQHLPPKSEYRTHRSSVSISEMSADDLEGFLREIETFYIDRQPANDTDAPIMIPGI